ncbi:MAG: universal stress protein [Solirubrobacteraceae bacterium]
MRLERILVPLDGSRLAEAALPAACSLARTLGARVDLLHVLERDPPAAIHGEPHLAGAEQARGYLDDVAGRLRGQGLEVDVRAAGQGTGDVAHALCSEATASRADLIVMCAHGATNLRGRLIGRTAARVVRHGSIPVLLRTVGSPEPPAFRLRELLVPLELWEDIGPALDAARTVAAPYGAGVTLLSVPEPPAPGAARLLPGTAALTRELERAEIVRRLDEVATDLRSALPKVHAVVADQRPAEAIVSLSASLPADLVIVVTDPDEPRPGWFEPSTAQALLARADLTLLLLKRTPRR